MRKTKYGLNAKFKCIKPEDAVEGKEYAFSYNPQDQPQFQKWYNMKLNTLTQWSQQMQDILTLRYSAVHVFLEISAKGRFHFHGTIIISDLIKFYLHDLAKLRNYGTYEIDTIGDETKWIDYCDKLNHHMSEYCIAHDIPLAYGSLEQ